MNTSRRTFLIGTASTSVVVAAALSVGAPLISSVKAYIASKPSTSYWPCNGNRLSYNLFPELAKAIGTTYGGDDVGFCVPELAGYKIAVEGDDHIPAGTIMLSDNAVGA